MPPFPNLLAPRGRAGQPGPRAENRERGKSLQDMAAAVEFAVLEDQMAPIDAAYPGIWGVLRKGLLQRVPGQWHRFAFVPLSPERSEILDSQARAALKSGGIRRHKSCSAIRLQSENSRSAHTGKAGVRDRSLASQSGTKGLQKAASLCHFCRVICDLCFTKLKRDHSGNTERSMKRNGQYFCDHDSWSPPSNTKEGQGTNDEEPAPRGDANQPT
jgi:hypothetical protein